MVLLAAEYRRGKVFVDPDWKVGKIAEEISDILPKLLIKAEMKQLVLIVDGSCRAQAVVYG